MPNRDERPGGRGRRRWPSGLFALLALAGLAISAIGIAQQLMPRTFTAEQRHAINGWILGNRWRTLSKVEIFPYRIGYQLPGAAIGSPGALRLSAQRLGIAPSATCAQADGANAQLTRELSASGCQSVLRATYADPTSSMVVTVGVAVLRRWSGTAQAARMLTGRAGLPGMSTTHPVLAPVAVPNSPAALFGFRQRQLSWVLSTGPYLVLATVGFADGRPRGPVRTDAYAFVEMTSLARGVALAVAKPLGAAPPPLSCPGGPSC